MYKYRVILAALCCAIVMGASAPGWGAFKPKVGLISATVTINGRAAIVFRTANAKLSAAARAAVTSDRLKTIVDGGAEPSSLFVKAGKHSARIYSGESMICVATSRDAKKAHSTPTALAQAWLLRTRILLAMPAVILSERELIIPIGEQRRVNVGGAATGPIYAASDKGEVAEVAVNRQGRYVRVGGTQVGHALVDVCVEGEHARLQVFVKKYAGRMAGAPAAQVTGNPCSSSVLIYAARQAVLRKVVLEPGARVDIPSIEHVARPLIRGQVRTATASVSISGEGYITYMARVPIEVRDVPMPHAEPSQLFYSNDPERISKYQLLFAGKLEPDKSTRVVYHHQNTMGKRAHLVIDLINPQPTPATFRICKGIGGPMVDTVQVGHVAGSEFVRGYMRDVGVIEHLPPNSRLVLVSEALGHLETASGILQIDQTKGQGSWVSISAIPPGQDEVSVGDILVSPNPLMLKLSDDIYPTPSRAVDASYVVGQRWAFIPIGKHPITDYSAKNTLDGNYGVTYTINIKAENPCRESRVVTVDFEPTAGLASGVFIIDGRLVTTRQIRPPMEAHLVSYRLRPGEIKRIRVITVPLAGSSYPAQLVVRS